MEDLEKRQFEWWSSLALDSSIEGLQRFSLSSACALVYPCLVRRCRCDRGEGLNYGIGNTIFGESRPILEFGTSLTKKNGKKRPFQSLFKMLLRANLINRGNPFFRYARSRVMGRADYSEKELASFVAPNVTKEGKWNGPVRYKSSKSLYHLGFYSKFVKTCSNRPNENLNSR